MVVVASPHQTLERLEITGAYETFLRLTQENDSPGKRFAYSDGLIEIKMPGYEHESLASLISYLILTYCLELDIDFFPWKSTTQRADFAEKGLEPDESFSFEKKKGDVPHLAVEVIHTHGSIDKLEVYRALNIKEVWFAYTDGDLKAYSLQDGSYKPVVDSSVLEGLSLGMIKESIRMDSVASAVKHFKSLIT